MPGRALLLHRAEVWFGWFLLAASLVGWPLSALTFAKDEPVTILGLSWLAITFTAYDILTSTRVHASVDEVKETNGETETDN